MKSNYDKCLKTILHHEGGYVNHPKDPGGETNLGVTKRVYQEHGGTKDMKDKFAKLEKLIIPLLIKLAKSPEAYIHWPNRAQVIEAQVKKIIEITRGK